MTAFLLDPNMLTVDSLGSVARFIRARSMDKTFEDLTEDGGVVYDLLIEKTGGKDVSKLANIPEFPTSGVHPMVHQWLIWEGVNAVKHMPQWEQLSDTRMALRTVMKWLREPNQRTAMLLGRFQPFSTGQRMSQLCRAVSAPSSASNIVAALPQHSNKSLHAEIRYVGLLRHRILAMLAEHLPPPPVPVAKKKP